MRDSLTISVDIADRIYKVKIKPEDEEVFRKSVEMVKGNIKEYAKLYAYKDKQDLLAMVLLQYVTSYMQTKEEVQFNKEGLIKKMEEIDSILNKEDLY